VLQSAIMRDLAVGRLRIGAVVETAGPTRATWLFPSATPEGLDRHRAWLAPHFLDAESRLLQSVHTFVVKTPDLTVLVDTCIGNDKDRGGRRPFHMLRTGFLETLKAAGVAPEAVDVVICTHLHVDHVGWNTRLDDGRWVPTFPRARYLFARREWEHWTSEAEEGTRRIMADSVAPVLDAGLAELVAMDHQVIDEIRLEPTPGHTPGHVSVRLASGGADAVITGDLMHHPVQIAEATWQTTFDTDPDAARETRRAFCARYGDRPVTVLGTHFHHPTAGRIVKHGDTWRFAVEA
jgi:glyoxylase-like metal-dependent hydrolase (beta-lactamase superfamily II)